MEQKLAGYSCGNSVGFSPTSLLSTLSRRPGACIKVTPLLLAGQGFRNEIRFGRLMLRLAGPLHAPKLRTFGHLPTMLDAKSEALVHRDIMLVRRFQIGG